MITSSRVTLLATTAAAAANADDHSRCRPTTLTPISSNSKPPHHLPSLEMGISEIFLPPPHFETATSSSTMQCDTLVRKKKGEMKTKRVTEDERKRYARSFLFFSIIQHHTNDRTRQGGGFPLLINLFSADTTPPPFVSSNGRCSSPPPHSKQATVGLLRPT